jgi:hypothetical protein
VDDDSCLDQVPQAAECNCILACRLSIGSCKAELLESVVHGGLGLAVTAEVECQSKWAVSTVQCKCYSQTVGLLAGGRSDDAEE